jgi:hypothetical protein
VKRELTPEERETFRRIMRPRENVSPFDDPEWIARDNARWDAAREREESIRRGDGDPYFNRVREAARATGGESCNPGREQQPSEEEG